MKTFRGKQGIQGEQGPAGSSDFEILYSLVDPVEGLTDKRIEVFASAPSSGTMLFWGQISISASALNTTTITPEVNSVALSAFEVKSTTPLGHFGVISVMGVASITAGQAFDLHVVVTGGGSIEVDTGIINYVIQ